MFIRSHGDGEGCVFEWGEGGSGGDGGGEAGDGGQGVVGVCEGGGWGAKAPPVVLIYMWEAVLSKQHSQYKWVMQENY